jgi:uncharacterized repeat protein (TIGR03803 family)
VLYDYPMNVDGTGESIALIELGGGYNPTDLSNYWSQLNLPKTPIVSAVPVGNGSNNPTRDPGGPDGEVMLDIEVSGAIAPGAKIVVYFAENTDAGFLNAITTAVHDSTNNPSVVSISWGGPESSWTQQAMTSIDEAFQSAAAMGVTVCVAAGDGGLAMDKSGNLFGVTVYGGSADAGVLYKVSEKEKFKILHSFGNRGDGCYPYGSVVLDKAGNLYGTTFECGSGPGTIWKVSKTGQEAILHNFSNSTSDGCNPQAGMTRDSKGNLYGVTDACGTYNAGVLFRVDVGGKFTLLHSFEVSTFTIPTGEVLRTAKGTLFGTTQNGGTSNNGMVWSYVP